MKELDEKMKKRKKQNIKILKFGCLPIFLLFCFISLLTNIADFSEEPKVTKEVPRVLLTVAKYKEKYPFKKDSLVLLCRDGHKVILWQEQTINAWAVNGNAIMVANKNRWGSIKDDNIWNGKDLGFVINLGLKLCN
ncbi:hypothetical protein LNI98_07060 [Tenacibaculum dicentrarchi]|uniref:hypothetical protein n=1 Tax=Tenacibaculum TaxID=104267 RepID=UPI00187BA3B4|nr:hypothetical protein [Tenacibaculum piscium]MBE7671650.1 hypothetical protein [Tenacibaculum piscium]MBE7686551.1 hypothetical protein [Tenacibaculum piscium]MBE7691222.1 hypothetical protein [Tenacibaculum piscium]MCD8449451.1 hypothetical protein [Tenacibaculum dicentrarchi]